MFLPCNDKQKIRNLLHTDPILGSYMLGDLIEPFWSCCTWHYAQQGTEESLCLQFQGEQITTLLTFGSEELFQHYILQMKDALPPRLYIKLRPKERAWMETYFTLSSVEAMYIYAHQKLVSHHTPQDVSARLLTINDLPLMEEVYRSYPGNFFEVTHLKQSPFLGVFERDILVSIAGTHVWNVEEKTATLGNIVTRTSHRNRSYGALAVTELVRHLQDLGISNIVLHVNQERYAAHACYEKCGFVRYGEVYDAYASKTPYPSSSNMT